MKSFAKKLLHLSSTKLKPSSLLQSTRKFHSTNQAKQEATQNVRRVKKNLFTTKHLLIYTGISLGLGAAATAYVLHQYNSNPLDSLLDKVIRSVRGPYRDYIALQGEGLSTVGNGCYTLLVDPGFDLEIPQNYFLRPGIVFQDQMDPELGGQVVIDDEYGNFLSCNWLPLAESDKLSVKINEHEALLKNLKRSLTLNQKRNSSLGMQGVETVNPSDYEQDPALAELKGAEYPSFGILYTREQNVASLKQNLKKMKEISTYAQPSQEQWMATLAFHYRDHVIYISTRYPINMMNYAILKEELKGDGMSPEQISKKIDYQAVGDDPISINNAKRFAQMASQATTNPEQIKRLMKQDLVHHFKRFAELNGMKKTTTETPAATTTTK